MKIWNVIILMCLTVVSSAFGYWTFDREPCFIMSDAIVYPNPANPQNPIDLHWTVKVLRTGCEVDFQRSIVDSHGVIWAFAPLKSSYTLLEIGTHKTHSAIPIMIPKGISPGKTTLTTFVRMKRFNNPLHDWFPIIYRAPNIEFDIN